MQAPSEFSAGSAFEWYRTMSQKDHRQLDASHCPQGHEDEGCVHDLRSGIAEHVKLEEASGIFAYDQASIRPSRCRAPFRLCPRIFLSLLSCSASIFCRRSRRGNNRKAAEEQSRGGRKAVKKPSRNSHGKSRQMV